MTQRTPNIIDKLASLVPGYRGYVERESRRIVDKHLRTHVADRLDASKRDLDALALRMTDAGEMSGLGDVDRLKRLIGQCADTLRHASAGESGLMDDRVIKEAELERVHQHDLDLEAQVGEAVETVSRVEIEGLRERMTEIRGLFQALLREIERRDEILREVFR